MKEIINRIRLSLYILFRGGQTELLSGKYIEISGEDFRLYLSYNKATKEGLLDVGTYLINSHNSYDNFKDSAKIFNDNLDPSQIQFKMADHPFLDPKNKLTLYRGK